MQEIVDWEPEIEVQLEEMNKQIIEIRLESDKNKQDADKYRELFMLFKNFINLFNSI